MVLGWQYVGGRSRRAEPEHDVAAESRLLDRLHARAAGPPSGAALCTGAQHSSRLDPHTPNTYHRKDMHL